MDKLNCDVVILKTKILSNINGPSALDGKIRFTRHSKSENSKVQNHHLYFMSKRKIKSGDWFYSLGFKNPFRCLEVDSQEKIHYESIGIGGVVSIMKFPTKNNLLLRKVEASTDLNLLGKDFPAIPFSFVEKYVDLIKAGKEHTREVCIDVCGCVEMDPFSPVFKEKDGTVKVSKVPNSIDLNLVKKEINDFMHWLGNERFIPPMVDNYFNNKNKV